MLAAPAHAGVYQDDLGKSLVKNSTAQDKQVRTQWIFFAISLNPQLNSYSNIPQDKRDAADKAIAGRFSRLAGDACANEAKLDIKYEGVGAFRGAFELLGQIAGRELFAAPEAAAGTSSSPNTWTPPTSRKNWTCLGSKA